MSKKKNKKNNKPKSKNTYSTQINNTNKNKDNMNEKDNRKKIIIEKDRILTDEGEYFSVVRYGSVFFEHTFRTLAEAINYCDEVI